MLYPGYDSALLLRLIPGFASLHHLQLHFPVSCLSTSSVKFTSAFLYYVNLLVYLGGLLTPRIAYFILLHLASLGLLTYFAGAPKLS